jgi:DNA-binding PucR family transcriptional regulator
MSITCNSILNMPSLKKNISLLGGKKGLNNPVRWTHVLESSEAIQFLQGNELTFMTCVYIGNDTEQLLAAIDGLYAQHVAGLVINTGRYIMKVPQKAVDKAELLGLPLFEIPWEISLVEVTKLIGAAIVESDKEEKSASFLLEKILMSDQNNYADYLHTAEFYGYSLSGPLRIANLEFINLLQYAERVSDRTSLSSCQHQIEQLVCRILESYSKKCMFMWKANNLIFIVPVEPEREVEQVDSIAHYIQDEVERHMSGLAVHMGLGGFYEGIEKLKKSYTEAQLALKLAKSDGGKTYVLYRNAGIYKFLNKLNDKNIMIDFYEETLGCLLQYDANNNTEFTETLRVYLEEGENTANTIQRLYIHRNTLQYRLHRIEEILQQSLKNSEEKINLQIAFKIQKFLNFKGFSIESKNKS